jgi:hypothetical protein
LQEKPRKRKMGMTDKILTQQKYNQARGNSALISTPVLALAPTFARTSRWPVLFVVAVVLRLCLPRLPSARDADALLERYRRPGR